MRVAEVLALEQLHHDEGHTLGRHAVVEDLHHVRAAQLRRGGRLALEARDGLGSRRDLGRHELHRDLRFPAPRAAATQTLPMPPRPSSLLSRTLWPTRVPAPTPFMTC